MTAAWSIIDPTAARAVTPPGGEASLDLTLKGFVAQPDPRSAVHPINPAHPSRRNQSREGVNPGRRAGSFTGSVTRPLRPSIRAGCQVFGSSTSLVVLFQGTDMDANQPAT